MSAAAIIQKAREEGLSLVVTERDTIKVIGPRVAANRWAPELVANKPAILAALRQTGAPPWPWICFAISRISSASEGYVPSLI
jgi:hypothetical protein